MEKYTYEEMYINEDDYWWFVGTRNIIFTQIGKFIGNKNNLTILDIGCGTGIVIKRLEEYGNVFGIDISSEAISFCRKRGIKNIIKADTTNLPFNDNTFDLITVLDVLEHIKHEGVAISEIYRVLKKNGKAIVTVPAFNFLWSDHDIALHHFRRYNIRNIKYKFLKNNFIVLNASYYNMILFPFIVIIRSLKKIFKKSKKYKEKRTDILHLPRIINQVLIFLLNIEAIILRKVTFPVGVSIFLFLQK